LETRAIGHNLQQKAYELDKFNSVIHWMDYMNDNQHDALFIFNLLSYYTSTCFGHISSPSLGGRIIYVSNGIVDCQWAWPEWNGIPAKPADSQLYSIGSTVCHIYTI
jgi:hypothetical protein